MARRRRSRRQLAGLGGIPAPVWWGLGAAALAVLFYKRKEITVAATKALTEAEKKILKTIVPAKGEEFIDLAFELGPRYKLNPNFILAFLAVESGFRLSPSETGDMLPRCLSRYSGTRLAVAKSLPGVVIKPAYDAYLKMTCDALVPTTTGWGFGPMQIDWVSHRDFLVSPAARTARGQMDYAIRAVILPAIATLQKKIPGIDPARLFDGVVAAYNAGAERAADAIAQGKDLTKLTAAEWYIPRVRAYMQTLSTLFGGDPANIFVA